MSCDKYKEMIAEHFGDRQLPKEIVLHTAGCAECAEYLNSLVEIASSIKDESTFYLDPELIEQTVTDIDSKIDQIETEKITVASPLWKSFVPVAAAVILVVGLSSMTNLFHLNNGNLVSDTALTDDKILITSTDETLDSDAYSDFLESYMSENNVTSSDWIFDDITDEELKYLEQNFDIGEIL